MALRKKTLLVISLTLLALMAALYISSEMILGQTYLDLERQDTIEDVTRAVNGLQDTINAFELIALGWSKWDDTRDFIADGNQDFIDVNLLDGMFIGTGFEWAVFLTADEEIVHNKWVDLTLGHEIPVPESILPHIEAGSPLLDHADESSEIGGVLLLPEGIMLVTSLPVLNSEGVGPITGKLVWGELFDETDQAHLAEEMRLNIHLFRLDSETLPAHVSGALAALSPDAPVLVQPASETLISGYTVMRDVYGQPALMLQVQQPRTVFAQGQASLTFFMLSMLVTGAAFTGAALFQLERGILRRLQRLSEGIGKIRETNDLHMRVPISGRDEISDLSTGFNSMVDALERARTKLQQAHDQLEQRVQERTQALSQANQQLETEIAERKQAQEELAIARDQAVEALRLKTQILANISHDARTPLNIISLHAELMHDGFYGPVSERQQHKIEDIQISTRQLLGFMNNMLGEAQMNGHKLKLQQIDFAPADLLDEVVTAMKPLARRKGVALERESGALDGLCTQGDPDRLRQVIMNLVDNAVKFSKEGKISLRLSQPDAGHWALEVQDEGQGIPADALESIFDAFYQVDGSVTRETNRGVGLGLSIVQQLVTLMHGKIDVRSTLGTGSTFTITLPLNTAEGEKDAAAVRDHR